MENKVVFKMYTYMKCYIWAIVCMLLALAFASDKVVLGALLICGSIFLSSGMIVKGLAEFMFIDPDDYDDDGDSEPVTDLGGE